MNRQNGKSTIKREKRTMWLILKSCIRSYGYWKLSLLELLAFGRLDWQYTLGGRKWLKKKKKKTKGTRIMMKPKED